MFPDLIFTCAGPGKKDRGSNRLCGSAREVNARSVSGDITLYMKNPDVKRIDSSSTSGSVEIDLPQSVPSVHAAMRSVSGTTRCAFPDAGNGASVQIQASTVSGSIRIA